MMTTKLRDETFTKKELEEVRERVLDGEDFTYWLKNFLKIQVQLVEVAT